MMKKQWISLSLITTLGLFTMASCGSDTETTETTTTTQTEAPATVDADDMDVLELVLEGDDAMKFNKNQLNAQAGQPIKFTLKHVGKLEKASMGHNFVLLVEDADVDAFALAAIDAADNDYIPASLDNQIIAHTKVIGGGEEVTIEFNAPSEAGKYPFICSFPGHASMMRGVMVVQ